MLSSEIEQEPSAEIEQADKLTTGRISVVTSRVGGPLTTGRMPVVIPGSMKKVPPRGEKGPVRTKHRLLMHALVVCVLGLSIVTTLVTFLPLGKDGQALGLDGLFQHLNLVNSDAKNSALVGSQAATATAIMQQDGYDPGRAVSAQYNASLGIDASGDAFPYGQCTYWASLRYHQMTGYWVPWSGNAYQWAYNAPAYSGWVVSSTPHVPSIVVFQPGVQYSSWVYGHVAVLEGINPDGSLHTSNMNVAGYPFGARVDLTNYTGSGVSFVYHT